MGLDIHRVPPHEWLCWAYDAKSRRTFLDQLSQVASTNFDMSVWEGSPSVPMRDFPDPYPSQRVGSYSGYGTLLLCMEEVVSGVDASELEEDEDIERQLLSEFRKQYGELRHSIPEAMHFLGMPDNEGAFVPVCFEEPFEFANESIGSLPGAIKALEAFAVVLKFNLNDSFEEEYDGEDWRPLATMRNVARILHRFFSADLNSVVIYM